MSQQTPYILSVKEKQFFFSFLLTSSRLSLTVNLATTVPLLSALPRLHSGTTPDRLHITSARRDGQQLDIYSCDITHHYQTKPHKSSQ